MDKFYNGKSVKPIPDEIAFPKYGENTMCGGTSSWVEGTCRKCGFVGVWDVWYHSDVELCDDCYYIGSVYKTLTSRQAKECRKIDGNVRLNRYNYDGAAVKYGTENTANKDDVFSSLIKTKDTRIERAQARLNELMRDDKTSEY